MSEDWIRDVVRERRDQLGWTAYEIAKRCGARLINGKLVGGKPGEKAIKGYLDGKCSLNTSNVSNIFWVMGLELKTTKPKPLPALRQNGSAALSSPRRTDSPRLCKPSA